MDVVKSDCSGIASRNNAFFFLWTRVKGHLAVMNREKSASYLGVAEDCSTAKCSMCGYMELNTSNVI